MLHIQLYQGPEFEMNECDGSACIELASIDLSPLDTGWHDLELPYDIRETTLVVGLACTSVGNDGVIARVAIFVTTAIGAGVPHSGGQLLYGRWYCFHKKHIRSTAPPHFPQPEPWQVHRRTTRSGYIRDVLPSHRPHRSGIARATYPNGPDHANCGDWRLARRPVLPASSVG